MQLNIQSKYLPNRALASKTVKNNYNNVYKTNASNRVDSFTKTNYSKLSSQNINFRGGLPNSFIKYVNQLDVKALEKKLSQKGIISDFKGSKAVAACVEKTVEIFEQYKLALPQKIEFAPINQSNTLGQCFSQIGFIQINSNYKEFNEIEKISILEESHGNFHPTKHFLATFIHEFVHCSHFQNILKKTDPEYASAIFDEFNEIQIRSLWTKIQGNGEYSKVNLKEYMAELLTRKITENLDDNLDFKSNPELRIFKDYTTEYKTPPSYTNTPSWAYAHENRNYIGDQDAVEAMMSTNKAIWDGDLKFIKLHGYGIKDQLTFTDLNSTAKTIKQIWDLFN